MKKKLAALLCGVMCVTAFTGCSKTELAYLKMSSDMLDTMFSCVVEGSMQADIDFDALYDFSADVAKATGVENDSTEPAFSGKKSVTLDYDMQMNMDKLEYDMAFDVNVNGKTYDLGKLYYSMDKGIYVTSQTLWGIYQIYDDTAEDYGSYIRTEAFAKDLQDILTTERYVELLSVEDLTGVEMGEALPEQGMADLYDAVYTFYVDVLEGFETGMVKEINGGYKIEADGRQVAQLVADLLQFVADHPEQIIDATEAYMMAVLDSIEAGTPEETAAAKAEMAALFEAGRASQDDFVDAAADMVVLVEELMEYPGADMIMDSFKYVATVKKTGGGFDAVSAYTVKHEGKTVCSLTSAAEMKEADTNILFPQWAMTADELDEKLAALENKYNPVTGVSITWNNDSKDADYFGLRPDAMDTYFTKSFGGIELVVEEGRAYMPLRVIAEVLGETVSWDNSTKTPYVMQNGERIDMKGILEDGTAYVGARDFEKMGYKVTFTSHKSDFDSYFDYKEILIEK